MDIKEWLLNTNKQGTKCATEQAHNLSLEIENHSQECDNNVTKNYLTVCHQAWRASKFTGKILVFLKPLWMFATVMAHDQGGQNTSQKEPLGRAFAFVPKFHSMRYLCHSFLNWANGVESKTWTIWLVWGGIAIT